MHATISFVAFHHANVYSHPLSADQGYQNAKSPTPKLVNSTSLPAQEEKANMKQEWIVLSTPIVSDYLDSPPKMLLTNSPPLTAKIESRVSLNCRMSATIEMFHKRVKTYSMGPLITPLQPDTSSLINLLLIILYSVIPRNRELPFLHEITWKKAPDFG